MTRQLPNRMRRVFGLVALALMAGLFAHSGEPVTWHPAKAPLMTRWAANVSPANVWPEYPRPQLVRTEWLNLNGLWDYAVTPDSIDKLPPASGKILVPFPLEAALSGVMTNLGEHSKLWYKRNFTVPMDWRSGRVRLHFGAVDWHCQVSVNGQLVGQHQGGYDAFTFDITDLLAWKGSDEVSVCVTDPTEGDQPRGKQSRKPGGIFYTSSSGIWQTVWLEPVPTVCIDALKAIPDVDSSSVRLSAAVNSFSDTIRIKAVAMVDGKEAGSVTGLANTNLILNLPHPHLWSPGDPFLYDLKVELYDGDKILDSVTSYFGMRKIALRKDDRGLTRMAFNDQFIFQVGTLDQGFWPDGIYTAPTDEALRSDIEFLKKNGFNVTRKHVKVEPDRWYYWCDKLGLLVWQDMPSGNNATAEGRRDFENELHRMVGDLENHPSIIVWILFNEGWGQYETEPLSEWLKKLDPSRLVDDASGWTDMHVGDLIDIHSYPGPNAPSAERNRAAVLGEMGGFGLIVPDHVWSSSHWGYLMLTNADELASQYSLALKKLWRLHNIGSLSGAIYTQTSDVETECNGLLTYDRAVAKTTQSVLFNANRGMHFQPPQKVILTNALFGKTLWKYTTEKAADDWLDPKFNASDWKEGVGGFGTKGTPGVFLNTTWDTSDIWLRREFVLEPQDFSELRLEVFHDEDAEIYLNGVLAAKLAGYITDYDEGEISKEAQASLLVGTNTIAVHCHQTVGGQGIDVGLIVPPASVGSGKNGH